MKPHDVFAKELLHCDLGRAMWVPEPSQDFGSIQIADIGYMDDGQFQTLFNASLPADHPRQAHGVPLEFECLEIPSCSSLDAYLQPQVLHSTTIRRLGGSASVTSSVVPAGGSVQFSSSSNEGAMVVLNGPLSRELAVNYRTFRTYVEKHYDSWYTFANHTLNLGIEQGQIILVYGCSKTTSWASAVFSNTARDACICISGGAFCAVGDVSVTSDVEHRGSMMCRRWPSDPIEGETVLHKDQTMFIRAWKARRRSSALDRILGMRLRAAARANPGDGRRFEPDEGAVGPLLSREGGSELSDSDSESFVQVPTYSPLKDFDPADALIDHILETSDVDIAIVSDDDWCQQVDQATKEIIESYTLRFFSKSPNIRAELHLHCTAAHTLFARYAQEVAEGDIFWRPPLHEIEEAQRNVSKILVILHHLVSVGANEAENIRGDEHELYIADRPFIQNEDITRGGHSIGDENEAGGSRSEHSENLGDFCSHDEYSVPAEEPGNIRDPALALYDNALDRVEHRFVKEPHVVLELLEHASILHSFSKGFAQGLFKEPEDQPSQLPLSKLIHNASAISSLLEGFYQRIECDIFANLHALSPRLGSIDQSTRFAPHSEDSCVSIPYSDTPTLVETCLSNTSIDTEISVKRHRDDESVSPTEDSASQSPKRAKVSQNLQLADATEWVVPVTHEQAAGEHASD